MYITKTIIEQKQCSKCKQYYLLNNFNIRSLKTNKPSAYCKSCTKLVSAIHYNSKCQITENIDWINNIEDREIVEKWIENSLTRTKLRASKKKLQFNLTKDYLLNIFPTICPVLNIPLVIGNSRNSDNSPSLDRIDNNKGYVIDNVFIISNRANWLKSNATIEELEAIVRYMKNE